MEDKNINKNMNITEIRTKKKRFSSKLLFQHENAILGVILVALIAGFGAMTGGKSTTMSNVSNIVLQSATRGLAAIGQLFVILTAGIDLSIGGIALFSMMIGATMMKGSPAMLGGAIAVMLVLGVGWGAINGTFIARVGMPALIVTLATWQILEGASWTVSQGFVITGLPRALAVFGQGRVGMMPVATIIFISVAVVAYLVLHYSSFGRSIYSVGGNPVSSWLSGVNVRSIMHYVYMISGFCGGIAGLIYTSRLMSGTLTGVSGLELDSITAAVIGGASLAGGRGTVIGVVLGTFILGIINNGMNLMTVHPAFQGIVKGIIVIAAVAVDYVKRRHERQY